MGTPATVVLSIAEADLEDPEALTWAELAGIAGDLTPLLADDALELELRIRATRAAATVVAAFTDRFRLVRGAIVRAAFEAGMSYPAIGDVMGVTGERARQWAHDAPASTTDNRSTK